MNEAGARRAGFNHPGVPYTPRWHQADACPAVASDGRSADWPLLRQLGLLSAILLVEFAAFRGWLPDASPDYAGTLTALLTERGPGTLRFVAVQFVVSFGMVSLLFGQSSVTGLRPVFGRLARRGTAWALLLAHSAAVLCFVALSVRLSGVPLSSPAGLALVALWSASGAAAVGLLAAASMPIAFWTLLFDRTRQVLTFAALVGAGAFVFGQLAMKVWHPLSRATLAVVYTMLHPIVPALTADPSALTMGVPDFMVEIQAGCSGYQGLGLMLVFIAAWLWFHRAEWRFPRAFVLVPVGLAGIWLLNCVRVAGLILIGVAGAPDIALGGFHSQAGWVAFNAVALGTCLAARRVPWLLRDGADHSASQSAFSNPTAVYLLPFLAVLAGSMVGQLTSAGFEWFYGVRVVLSAAALCYLIPKYRGLDWRVSWQSLALGMGVYAIWVGSEALFRAAAPAVMPEALRAASLPLRSVWITARILGSVVTIPIAEELAFRGFLLRRLDSEDFESVAWTAVSWTAILLSSVVFGLMHGERWIAGTLAGSLYAAAYLRRGSIGDAVTAHALTNALLAAEVLLAGHWQFW